LLIVPKDDFSESDRQEIWQTVQANLQGLTVDVKLTEAIPRTRANKWRPVMTKVKK